VDQDPQLVSITQEEFNRYEMLKVNKSMEREEPFMDMPIAELEKLANLIIDSANMMPDNPRADPDASYCLKL